MRVVSPARHLLVLLVVVILAGCRSGAAAEHDYSPDISESDLRADVSYLASDRLGGREVGTPGVAAAEDFIAARFRESGLKTPPGEKSYFISFTLYRANFGNRVSVNLEVGGRTFALTKDVGFEVFPFSGTADMTASLVFAGYGITAPKYDYDDYRGLDVGGKFVLVLRHEPNENDPQSAFAGTEQTPYSYFLTKAENARDHGAVGMLVVTDPRNHDGSDDLRNLFDLYADPNAARGQNIGSQFGMRARPVRDNFPAIQISQQLAEQAVAAAGADLVSLQRAIDAGTAVSSLAIGAMTAHVDLVGSADAEQVPIRDVAAIIRGSDPALRDQWIVVGAHHDHLGTFEGSGDTIYNGADDNASGTAGVLELADYFSRQVPADTIRRSMVFVTFSAEEEGLLGSEQFAAHGPIPIGRIAFDVNLDMIGRNPDKPVEVWGDGYGTTTKELLSGLPGADALQLEFTGRTRRADSDFYSFFRRGVPYLSLFTGYHDDYHQPGDSPEKLDYAHMAALLRLSAEFITHLVGDAAIPTFVK